LKTLLQTNKTPSKALFTDKKCHAELTNQRLSLEEGMLCQLVQPNNLTNATKNCPENSLNNHPCRMSRNAIGRTHRNLQNALENSSKILVAQHEQRRSKSADRIRSSSPTNPWSLVNGQTIRSQEHGCVASMKMQTSTTTMKNQKATLTSLHSLTGFASVAFAPQIDSDMMAQ
jgi:hypothetical protein